MTDDIVQRLRDLYRPLLCWEAASEIERLRAEANEIAAWIVRETGYPFGMFEAAPPSEPWRRRIEEAWLAWDEARDPDTDRDLRQTVAEQGGWAK